MKKLFTLLCRRWKEKNGFTLSETLITVLILLMVSAIVAGGVPSAVRAYYKIIDAANAQLLLSDTVMSLRSELAVAVDVELADGSTTLESYTNGNSGWHKKLGNSGKGITTEEIKKETGEDGPKSRGVQLLVPKSMSGAIESKTALITSYKSITYDKTTGVFTVEDLMVKKGNNILGKIDQLKIQNIIPKFSN